MHDFATWSLNLGRWSGIHVRLHIFFLLFAVCTFFLCTQGSEFGDSTLSSQDGATPLVWVCALALAILFASVLFHEFGHVYATFRVGGNVDQVVIGPFGGLSQGRVPHDPLSELITGVAGPLCNLFVCILVAPLLYFAADVNPFGLLHPVLPEAVEKGSLYLVTLKLTFWLNWVLTLVNALPAHPFDGGTVLRSVLWRFFGFRTAVLYVARAAKLAAVSICGMAWLMHRTHPDIPVPVWVPLTLLAIFLYFSAKQDIVRLVYDDHDEENLGYDFSLGYTSLHREETSPTEQPDLLQQWRRKRRLAKEEQRRAQEEAEESRVDAILARLHESGMEGLSPEERTLLERVSARYRNRQED